MIVKDNMSNEITIKKEHKTLNHVATLVTGDKHGRGQHKNSNNCGKFKERSQFRSRKDVKCFYYGRISHIMKNC